MVKFSRPHAVAGRGGGITGGWEPSRTGLRGWFLSPASAAPFLAGHYASSWARVHGDLAVLGTLAWEVACLLVAFFAGLARKVRDGLQEIWSKAIVEAIDQRTRSWLAIAGPGRRGYEQTYRRYIEQLCGNADQSGLPSLPPKPGGLMRYLSM